jgi:IS5 family transposase
MIRSFRSFEQGMSKTHGQFSFFDLENRLEKIHQLNDFLPRLNSLVDWEIFRGPLNKVREKERLSNAGRPPFDVVLMFKVLVLKSLYNLSDESTELMIRDRISFMEFLGLSFADRVPDAKTIWLFAEQLKELGLERQLFEQFERELVHQGFAAKGGYIVDGSFVEVPKQRNTKEENAAIKAGNVPETISKNPNVFAQKDRDARWTKKNNVSSFGYKNHVLADEKHQLIREWRVTDASVHDSVPFLDLVPTKPLKKNQAVFADSAYAGAEIEVTLKERRFQPRICEKGYRNKPLTDEQKERNREKSRIRCRVEHVFGAMKTCCRDEILRVIGMARMRFWIGLRNLTYNMGRLVSLKRPKVG